MHKRDLYMHKRDLLIYLILERLSKYQHTIIMHCTKETYICAKETYICAKRPAYRFDTGETFKISAHYHNALYRRKTI